MTKAKRRLAAILAADVAGYSRLMGDDEEATIAALEASREIFRDRIVAHSGRVVDTAGDSVLATFESVVEAVRGAVEIQNVLAESNSDRPEKRRMRFRIGVNLGDVVEKDDGTVYGDGVNVAARLEALAEPGSITISGTAFDHVDGKLEVTLESIGEHDVKNIAKPVRAYRIRISYPSAANETESALKLPDKPSIAVLAFDNLSGDPEQEYFADGIAEDIITALSKVGGLFVVARNSTFAYKNQSQDVRQMSRDLGVRSILEGSVRKAANRVRVTAQLIDGATGGHLWAERYERELNDIFAVQDEITHEIVAALAIKLTPATERHLNQRGTENLEAYDFYLKGREYWWQHTRESNTQAQLLMRRAIDVDPSYARALAILSLSHGQDYANRWSASPEDSKRQQYEFAQQAVAADDTEPEAHFALGTSYLWSRKHDRVMAEAERSIQLSPNFSLGHMLLGWAHHYADQHDKAIELLDTAMRFDPHYPGIMLHFQAQAHFMLGRFDTAAKILKRRLIRDPSSDISRVLLAACYGHLGRDADAEREWSEALRVNPDYSLEHRRQTLPYRNPANFGRIVDGLRKAGLDIPDEPTAAD